VDVEDAFTLFAWAIGLGETAHVLVRDAGMEGRVRARLEAAGVRRFALHRVRTCDAWIRDYGPIVLARGRDRSRERLALDFTFNAWGGKYPELLPDDTVPRRLRRALHLPTRPVPLVLEGGSIDGNGAGTVLTSEQCLLNPNRNPGLSQAALEARLADGLGADRVLWLADGLLNDHTDGHVDTIARFVAPGVVVCMEPSGGGDPNMAAMKEILRDLASMRDAKGRRLEVFTVPSPGVVTDPDDEMMAASYVNFYVANTTVTVPVYGVPNDGPALKRIEALFPGRRVHDVPARELLLGGGAFHCISQQQPKGGRG
jgi:agmatine deiminase